MAEAAAGKGPTSGHATTTGVPGRPSAVPIRVRKAQRAQIMCARCCRHSGPPPHLAADAKRGRYEDDRGFHGGPPRGFPAPPHEGAWRDRANSRGPPAGHWGGEQQQHQQQWQDRHHPPPAFHGGSAHPISQQQGPGGGGRPALGHSGGGRGPGGGGRGGGGGGRGGGRSGPECIEINRRLTGSKGNSRVRRCWEREQQAALLARRCRSCSPSGARPLPRRTPSRAHLEECTRTSKGSPQPALGVEARTPASSPPAHPAHHHRCFKTIAPHHLP
jgi:hypothetical protein